MSDLKNISESTAIEQHAEMWKEAIAEYGDSFKVPHTVISEINDRYRAIHALLKWKRDGHSSNPIKYLSQYGILPSNLAFVAREYCNIDVDETTVIDEVKPVRRANKYDSLIDWAKGRVFEQYTTDQLVEQAGFSYQTTLKFLQESPYFRKVKKGLWEIRDPKADKEAGI